jgi:hypothetical protein
VRPRWWRERCTYNHLGEACNPPWDTDESDFAEMEDQFMQLGGEIPLANDKPEHCLWCGMIHDRCTPPCRRRHHNPRAKHISKGADDG